MADVLTLSSISQSLGVPVWALFVILTWSLVWKAVALWKSARLNQPVWFIIILFINTVGILEILYIFLFSKITLPNGKSSNRKNNSGNKRKSLK